MTTKKISVGKVKGKWYCDSCGAYELRTHEDTATAGAPYCSAIMPDGGMCENEMEFARIQPKIEIVTNK